MPRHRLPRHPGPVLARTLAMACAALLTLLPGPGRAQEAQPAAQALRPALWRIQLPGGGSAWLFGAMAYGRKGDAPLPGYVQKALADSESLASELRLPPDRVAAAEAIAGMRQPGASFRAGLGPEQSSRYDALCRERQLPCEQLDGLPPFFLLGTLAKVLAAQQGLAPALGSAGAVHEIWRDKPFIELEGQDAGLALLRELPAPDQHQLLEQLLSQRGADSLTAYEAWRRGDVAGLQAQLSETSFSAPTRARLLTSRHGQWRDKLMAYLRAGRRVFVSVGAGHLGGSEGLDALLRAEGFKIERVDG